jgi:hypothetical protein
MMAGYGDFITKGWIELYRRCQFAATMQKSRFQRKTIATIAGLPLIATGLCVQYAGLCV